MTTAEKTRLLRRLSYLNGATCATIGAMHVIRGAEGTPGLDEASASEDSQEAFFGAIFAGYGAIWIWAARQPLIPAGPVRLLAATMALGGIGRVRSIQRRGLPHPFWLAMTGVEFVVPGLFLWLAGSDASASAAGADRT